MPSTNAVSRSEPCGDRAERQRELIDNLHDLVSALDRRIPRIASDDEQRIAQDAAALKARALERITQLEAGQRER